MGRHLIDHSGGAQPDDMTPAQRAEVMKAWEDWYAGLGEAVVDAGQPDRRGQVGGARRRRQ